MKHALSLPTHNHVTIHFHARNLHYILYQSNDTAILSAVTTRRAAIRTTCNTREGEINACATTDALAALLTNPAEVEDSEGNMVANTEPFITRWPE